MEKLLSEREHGVAVHLVHLRGADTGIATFASRKVGVCVQAKAERCPYRDENVSNSKNVVLGGAAAACDCVSPLASRAVELVSCTGTREGGRSPGRRMRTCRHVSGFGSDSSGGLPALVQPVVASSVPSLRSRSSGDPLVACVTYPKRCGAVPRRRRCLPPASVAPCRADGGWHSNRAETDPLALCQRRLRSNTCCTSLRGIGRSGGPTDAVDANGARGPRSSAPTIESESESELDRAVFR